MAEGRGCGFTMGDAALTGVSPARWRWLAAALLAAPLLLLAVPAAAIDFEVRLSSNSVAEGGSVTVTVRCTRNCTLFAMPSAQHRYTSAYMDIAITSSSGVSLSSNKRVTFSPPGTAGTSSGTVTISTTDDSLRQGNRTVTVSASLPYAAAHYTSGPTPRSSYWYFYSNEPPITSATLTVLDNEPEIVLSRSTALAVTEGQEAAYTVRLSRVPTGNVRVLATRTSNAIQVRTPGGPWASSLSLNYTTSNWNTGQTVQVMGVEDANAGSTSSQVRHSIVDAQSANEYDSAPDVDLTVNVTDDETAAIVASPSMLGVTEEGSSGAYAVRLSHVPTGPVRVLVARETAAIQVRTPGGPWASSLALNYTTSNWNTGQTVEVSAPADANVANETVAIRHTVNTGWSSVRAAEYDGVTTNVAVAVTDNDVLTVSPRAVTVQEGGSGGSYTVALGAAPTGPVTVTATSQSAAVALDTDGTPQTRTLTFSTTNWNTAQAVTVSPTNDADGVDETVTIQHTAAAGSGDPAFNFAARTQEDVTVTVDDDDPAPGVTLSAAAVAVNEDPAAGGGTTAHEGTYTVVLDAGLKAGESVAVEVSSGDANAVQVGAAGGTLGSTA